MQKIFAWMSFGLTLVSSSMVMAGLFMSTTLGTMAPTLIWAGFGFLGLAVLLAVVILVTAAIG
jgi:hypothetical protein